MAVVELLHQRIASTRFESLPRDDWEWNSQVLIYVCADVDWRAYNTRSSGRPWFAHGRSPVIVGFHTQKQLSQGYTPDPELLLTQDRLVVSGVPCGLQGRKCRQVILMLKHENELRTFMGLSWRHHNLYNDTRLYSWSLHYCVLTMICLSYGCKRWGLPWDG